jgi:hypothetical protein
MSRKRNSKRRLQTYRPTAAEMALERRSSASALNISMLPSALAGLAASPESASAEPKKGPHQTAPPNQSSNVPEESQAATRRSADASVASAVVTPQEANPPPRHAPTESLLLASSSDPTVFVTTPLDRSSTGVGGAQSHNGGGVNVGALPVRTPQPGPPGVNTTPAIISAAPTSNPSTPATSSVAANSNPASPTAASPPANTSGNSANSSVPVATPASPTTQDTGQSQVTRTSPLSGHNGPSVSPSLSGAAGSDTTSHGGTTQSGTTNTSRTQNTTPTSGTVANGSTPQGPAKGSGASTGPQTPSAPGGALSGGTNSGGPGGIGTGGYAGPLVFGRPVVAGSGIIARAIGLKGTEPYGSPAGDSRGVTDVGDSGFRAVDSLIVRYIDAALNGIAQNTTASFSTTIPLTITDSVGTETFSYSYT